MDVGSHVPQSCTTEAGASSAEATTEDLAEEGRQKKCRKTQQDLAASQAEVPIIPTPTLTQEPTAASWTKDRIPGPRPELEL